MILDKTYLELVVKYLEEQNIDVLNDIVTLIVD